MWRRLLVAVVLVSVAVWVWMLAPSGGSRVESPQSSPSAPEVEAPPVVLDGPSGPPEARPSTRAAEGSRSKAVDGKRVATIGPPLPITPMFVVHVEDETERPVAGVPVRFIDLSAAFESTGWIDYRNVMDDELDTLSARLGTSFVSDEAGLVQVPRQGVGGIVTAELGDLWGWTLFDPYSYEDHDSDQDEHETLVLKEDLALEVHVVDQSGAPVAGVPVAFRYRDEEEVQDAFRTPTDASGQARIRHLQELLEDGIVEAGACVSLAMLALAPVEYALRPGSLPRAPIWLVLPAAGSLEIRLEDAEGRLLEADAQVEIEIATQGERSDDEEWSRKYLDHPRDDQRLNLFARGGRARIEYIGLAFDLDVRVKPVNGFRRPLEVRQRGPQRPGEHVIARVPVLERLAALSGTILRPDGSAWSGRKARADLWVESDRGQGRGARLVTDARGRFLVPIDGDWPLEGRYSLEFSYDEPDGRRWWHREEWDAALVPGENDLGELVVEPLPVIAGGRVVDAAGAPLSEAWVELVGRPEDWDADWVGSDSTDARGRFLLQGHLAAPHLELTVGCEGFATRSFEAENGAEDQDLTLQIGGGIDGWVLVSHEHALEVLRVAVTDEVGARAEADLDGTGRFAVSGLSPGRYEVELELEHEPEFVFVVSGVIVRAGEPCRDPRLQPIDLRGILHTFTVTLNGPEEEDVYDFFLQRRPSGADGFTVGEWTRDESFTTSHAALDLRLTARRCRTEELPGLAEDRTLELRRALGFEVKVVPPLSLSDGEYLELILENRDGAVIDDSFEPRFWDGENAEALVPEAGFYSPRLDFLQQAVGDPRSTSLPLEPGLVLHVEERDEPQRFEIVLPPVALAAIERARADPPPRNK